MVNSSVNIKKTNNHCHFKPLHAKENTTCWKCRSWLGYAQKRDEHNLVNAIPTPPDYW